VWCRCVPYWVLGCTLGANSDQLIGREFWVADISRWGLPAAFHVGMITFCRYGLMC
jgi:hypothetical protein